jgi:hypothetical protein
MVKTVATILSYGMGVESSAILLRWIMSPATRPVTWSIKMPIRPYLCHLGRA